MTEITGHSRLKQLVRVRQAVMRLSKKLIPHYGLPFIARQIGNRDHTTVLHALRFLDYKKAAKADEIAACIEAILEVGPIKSIPRIAPPPEPPAEPVPVPVADLVRLPPWMQARLDAGMSPYHAARLAKWQGYEWVSP